MSHDIPIYKTNAVGELFEIAFYQDDAIWTELNTATGVDFIFSFKFGLVNKRVSASLVNDATSQLVARFVTPAGFFAGMQGDGFMEAEILIGPTKRIPTIDQLKFKVEKSADEV